jgi:hypothetical protein
VAFFRLDRRKSMTISVLSPINGIKQLRLARIAFGA